MNKTNSKSHLGMIIILGSLWGLTEAVLGLGLKSCATLVSGSIMAGIAFFFLAAVWVFSRKITTLLMVVLMASLFKMFDALLLSLPLQHGTISNPIFAFVIQAFAFVIFIKIIKEKVIKRSAGQALLGGLAALLSVNLFPLVKFVTGFPACTIAGTGYPMALYFIHISVLVSGIGVTLGFWIGNQLAAVNFSHSFKAKKVNFVITPTTLILCLTIIMILRLSS
jgi:hypothetical protein